MDKTKQRNTHSIEEKLRILKLLDAHVGTRVELAKQLCLPISTLNTIIKNRGNIEKNANQCGPMAKKRKYVKSSKYEKMEDILKEWFISARSANIPISGNVLREKALCIAAKLNMDNFTASNGWVDRFKQRHNVVYKAICGESKSVDPQTVSHWKESQVPELIKDYTPKDIFNADETGLFFNVLPSKTMTFKGENCHGGKLSKQRLTVLLITNSDGSEKLPLFVIGKAHKPRCFKNIKTLPTRYTANKKAWMTSKLFEEQLHALDAKMGAQNRKIILFIDQCPAHPPTVHLRNIKLTFFPANCTSELQPLDLGIIHTLKLNYRKSLVQRAVTLLDAGKDPKNMKVNVLDAIHYVAQAWKNVKTSTISNCFKKAGLFIVNTEVLLPEPSTEDDGLEFDDVWTQLETGKSFEDFVQMDSQLATSGIQSLDDIVDIHQGENAFVDTEEEDDDNETRVPSACETFSAIDTLRNYLSSVNSDPNVFDNLYQLEKQIQDISRKNKCKQSKISDYFAK